MEVSSDVRRLFAISGLEGYEKLRRENDELLATLSSMQARMTERLKSFSGVSMTEVRPEERERINEGGNWRGGSISGMEGFCFFSTQPKYFFHLKNIKKQCCFCGTVELRSCVKVRMVILGCLSPSSPYGLCGHRAA